MPRRNRKPKSRRMSLGTLSPGQRYELLRGFDYFGAGFLKDEESRREAWTQHRDELIEYWRADPEEWKRWSDTNPEASSLAYPQPEGPGSRPWGWWAYEAPEMRRPIGEKMPAEILCHQRPDEPALTIKCPKGYTDKYWVHATYYGAPRIQGGDTHWEYEHETEYLFRLGLMSDEEQEQVRASWPDTEANIREDIAGWLDPEVGIDGWAEEYLDARRNEGIPDDFDSGELTQEQKPAVQRALDRESACKEGTEQ